jgi:hypothetical protein
MNISADSPREQVAMTPDLAQIIAEAAEEAALLERNGAGFSVGRVRELLAQIGQAAEEYMTWLSEGDAAIRSGFSMTWLRGRFDSLQRDGHAKLVGKARQYRACAIPRRANTALASARGREAARAARRSA